MRNQSLQHRQPDGSTLFQPLDRHERAHMKNDMDTIRAIDLQHGKLYDCTIDTDHGGKETDSFVQLAIDAKTNRRWMLFGKKWDYAVDGSRG